MLVQGGFFVDGIRQAIDITERRADARGPACNHASLEFSPSLSMDKPTASKEPTSKSTGNQGSVVEDDRCTWQPRREELEVPVLHRRACDSQGNGEAACN